MQRAHSLKPTEVPHSAHVLLLVDVINPLHFPNARALLPHALEAARHIARFKSRLALRKVAAIYANDNYGTWHSEFSDILAACQALPGARGEIAHLLAPTASDLVILKPQHSAFHSTPLLHLLRRMEARRLTIVGFATDMCVMLTATDARMSGYSVRVPEDCTAAESPRRKLEVLCQLQDTFKCSVRPTQRQAGEEKR
ncbi:Peroxyureidoacrylate/ureidoacrylate amidohydrolase RutB [Comamonas sp. PE63]|uniref:Peroxyureidoacrylate/ureidoacrylate amidohydrolase RutB n=1 Tax=Comamonas brasiliensis TaxID=1812482 RepID=A0ABS5LQH5_9BURK|nr:isochorismatase family cysteine hydrolase [Comamonas sp. PE63]MBS3018456.1 Peroxyureidoacrylate/ureidoacrylate amidohydrolase RutB [Comamonas sp. PE63]